MQPLDGCPGSSAGPAHTPEPTTPHLALAVWPPPNPNLPDSYLAASHGQQRIAPELAARAVLAYTDPGDLVADPACSAGSVLVEAIRNGRRAIGVEADPLLAALATANISHARDQGAPGRAAVLEGNPDQLPRLLTKAAAILNRDGGQGKLRRHPAGSTRLILTAAKTREPPELLPVLQRVLAPGGFLLLVLDQPDDEARSGLGEIVSAAEDTGLHYWQHVIALRTRPGARESDGRPVLVHTDVLAFRKPTPARNAQAKQSRAAVSA